MRSVRADRGAAEFLDDQGHVVSYVDAAGLAMAPALQGHSLRKASVALVPPKPKELDSAARIGIGARDVRHEVEVALRIAVDQVRRGRRDLVADREHREHRLDAARRTEQVAGHRLGGAHGQLVRVIAECALDRDALGDVAQRCRRAVRIDVVDVGRREPGVAKRVQHAAPRAVAILGRRRDVVRVGAHAVARQFA